VPERVWQEMAKGLLERTPSVLFGVLRDCGALARVLPQLDALYDEGLEGEALQALDAAAVAGAALEVRFAALARVLEPEAVEALCAKLKAPANCRDLALLAARHAHTIADAADLNAEELQVLFDSADAWRRPERFRDLVNAALAGVAGAAAGRARLRKAHDAALAVDAGAVAKTQKTADGIKSAVAQARLAAIQGAG
jgi:tRNA nucleotidyltransferase (CCA-adding enzyme)